MRFTCAGGPWRSVELRHLAEQMMANAVAVSHGPAVAELLTRVSQNANLPVKKIAREVAAERSHHKTRAVKEVRRCGHATNGQRQTRRSKG